MGRGEDELLRSSRGNATGKTATDYEAKTGWPEPVALSKDKVGWWVAGKSRRQGLRPTSFRHQSLEPWTGEMMGGLWGAEAMCGE